MADEVIIGEHNISNVQKNGVAISGVLGRHITSQVLDVATKSAALNSATEIVKIQANGVPIWYKTGDSTVSATANTDGNHLIPSNEYVLIEVGKPASFTHIDTAADS